MNDFDTIEEAIEEIKAGQIVMVVDDEDRENEGDMICAAETINPDTVNFLSKYARGLICVPLTRERLQQLDLDPMVVVNTAKLGTRFTVSVDLLEGTSTGISAHDRAATIRALVNRETKPGDLGRPGHIFPIQALDGGVLARAGHTEATVDLAKLAGLQAAGVLCEIMDDDGEMARLSKLWELKERFGLKLITIKDLIAFRSRTEKLVRRITSVHFPTRFGEFKLHLYKSDIDEHHHLAVVKGEVEDKENVLVRVHSQCLTGDVLGSARCDCGDQLSMALKMIEKEGLGVLLYMRQEGRGIGLANKILAYSLQDEGLDTVEANRRLGFDADLRDYGIGAQILSDLGIKSMRVLTNNPKKIVGIQGHGLKVTGRVPMEITPTCYNYRYLETKRDKLGHLVEVAKPEGCESVDSEKDIAKST